MKSPFKLSGERILVTGATGFLGSHLCRLLCAASKEVHAISRRPHVSSACLRWWQADLADFDATRDLLNAVKPEVIFHLTSHGWGAPGLEHVLPTLRNDLVATVNLLTAIAELKVRRVILTASMEEPQSDGLELVPSSPYAAAKWASGVYARMFHRLYQTPVVVARIFMAYGPGQPIQKLIPYVIRSLLKEEAPKLSSGQRLVDWIYVDDVVGGLLAAAQASAIEGCTVDLGSGSLVSIRDMVDLLVSLVGPQIRPLYGALPPRPMEPVRAANIKDAYDKLGWRAEMPLEKGLELTVNWYKTQLKGTDFAARFRMTTLEENQSQRHGRLEPRSKS